MSRTSDILHLSFDVGKTILENGGETYRAQETIDRVAAAYGMPGTESFVLPTGIVASVTDEQGETLSFSRRIMHRTINLEKVACANALARSIEHKPVLPAAAMEQLRTIQALTGVPTALAIFYSAFISAFFTLFFKGGWGEFLVSLVTGAAVRSVLLLNDKAGFGAFFGNAAGGITAALIPILVIQTGIHLEYDKVIIGAIMLLVPGIAIVNAIRDTISGELLSGTTRAVEAFVLSTGIALGTGITLKFWYLLHV